MAVRLELTLRPAAESDFEFAFAAKHAALGPHVAVRWGWDDSYQRTVHRRRWSEKPWFVMLLDGEAIGTVSILDERDCSRFGEFYLLPAFQRQWLGTRVLTEFLEQCDRTGRAVRLECLKWNPVMSLYRRAGFEVVSENDIHYFMLRRPAGRIFQ